MFLSPELYDEVELLADGQQQGWSLWKGQTGYVSYASYTGWFLVDLGKGPEAPAFRFEQRHLGVTIKISKPRRGQKKAAQDIGSFKDRP